jgi:serine/threonine-protein kinase HipA
MAPRTFKHVTRIEVHLWGHKVGAIAQDPRSGFYAFRYEDSFRQLGIEPSPLQMPTNADRTHIFPNLPQRTYHRLPALVNDSLPDNFGNALIEKSLFAMGVPKEKITPLDRLAYLGNRAMGALQFHPPQSEVKQATAIELRDLVEEARKAVRGDPDGDEGTQGLQHILAVGISAGGARPKAVVCWNPSTGAFRSGQFDAPEGFEHWLLKFDGIENGQLGGPVNEGRIEYAYHLMAKAAGIRMADCRLHEEGGRAHFMTRRFDRSSASNRHHIQTLCAMDHMDLGQMGAYSYGQNFDVMTRLNLSDADLEQAFRRMAFNVMARNLDDHTKNVSFLLRQGGSWELAPAYDLTFAFDPSGRWNYQHFLAVNGKHEGIGRKDLLQEAERFSIGKAKGMLDEVRAAVERWGEFAGQAGLAKEAISRVEKNLRPS